MANNSNPDKEASSAVSDLGLHGLLRPVCPQAEIRRLFFFFCFFFLFFFVMFAVNGLTVYLE